MAKGKLIFLGTGTSQGIPVIGSSHPVSKSKDSRDKRLRTSAYVITENCSLLIDCGPDFRYQMLREGLHHLDAILITHGHSDHIAGLDDIRPIYFIKGHNVPIYANCESIESIKSRFDYFFSEDKYPGAPSVDTHCIDNNPIEINGLIISPVAVKHGNLDVLGFKIGNLVYITDANYIAESEIEKIFGVEILVVNALRHEPHHSHYNLEEALMLADKCSVKRAYFTHISQYLGFHEQVEQTLPKNRFLAYDGLAIEFDY